MAKGNKEELIEKLKNRGLTCQKLKNMEKTQHNDAGNFRKAGFIGIANAEEETARRIKALRKKVCLLK